MYFSWSRVFWVMIAVATFFLLSCAAPQKMEPPEPIATSLDQMPDDIAMVVRAMQQQIAGSDRGQPQAIRFTSETASSLPQTWSFLEGFTPTGTQLYTYATAADAPATKTASGCLDFEGPLGRRASATYHTRFRPSEDDLVVEEAGMTPVYASFPEPMMFVVPIEALSQGMGAYSETYAALLQFVGERAIDPAKSESFPMDKKDYVIFVFLRDRISPSSKLEVKISEDKAGTRGYQDSTSYIDFDGWRVALLPGRFTLFDDSGTAPLHLKTVFTPGTEVSTPRRAPKLVGLFHLDGTTPEP